MNFVDFSTVTVSIEPKELLPDRVLPQYTPLAQLYADADISAQKFCELISMVESTTDRHAVPHFDLDSPNGPIGPIRLAMPVLCEIPFEISEIKAFQITERLWSEVIQYAYPDGLLENKINKYIGRSIPEAMKGLLQDLSEIELNYKLQEQATFGDIVKHIFGVTRYPYAERLEHFTIETKIDLNKYNREADAIISDIKKLSDN